MVATKRRCRRETTRCTRALGIAGVGAAPARPRPEPPAARGASAAVGPRLQQPLPKTEEGQEDGDRGRFVVDLETWQDAIGRKLAYLRRKGLEPQAVPALG